MLFVCLGVGLVVAIILNLPDLYELHNSGDGQSNIGVAFYLASSSIGYGLVLWAVAIIVLVVVEFVTKVVGVPLL